MGPHFSSLAYVLFRHITMILSLPSVLSILSTPELIWMWERVGLAGLRDYLQV